MAASLGELPVLATADLDQQRTDLQFSPNVTWVEFSSAVWAVGEEIEPAQNLPAETGVRALYARLAGAYESEPVVADRRGGVLGDPFPL